MRLNIRKNLYRSWVVISILFCAAGIAGWTRSLHVRESVIYSGVQKSIRVESIESGLVILVHFVPPRNGPTFSYTRGRRGYTYLPPDGGWGQTPYSAVLANPRIFGFQFTRVADALYVLRIPYAAVVLLSAIPGSFVLARRLKCGRGDGVDFQTLRRDSDISPVGEV